MPKDDQRTPAGHAPLDRQAVLAQFGSSALRNRDLDSVLDGAVRIMADLFGTELSMLALMEPSRDALVVAAARGWKEGAAGIARIPAADVAEVLDSPDPVVVDDDADERRSLVPSILADFGIRSGISVAVMSENGPLGVLSGYGREPHSYGPDDSYILQNLANILSMTIIRLRAEEALRESEARARAVLETTVDGIITIDVYGTIQSFNPAAERIFGYEAGEVLGKNVDVLMPQPYKEEHDEYLRSYRETGRRKIIGIGREVVGRRKDGSTFPLDLAVSEVRLGDRRLFTGVVRDITERRQLGQEILQISEQERRRIGQDLHDGLGQMLTGLGLISRNLARKLERNGIEHASDLADIADLIHEADEFARGLARGLVPVDLEASGLRSALQRLSSGAEKLFAIRCTFEEVGTVLVEDNIVATHLYRIAQEALSNAVKHGKAGHIKISLAGGEEQVRLRVHDDGIGFPEGDHEEANGSGMGVRIMRHRARILGAHLEIGRGVSGGTVITCTVRNLGAPIPMGGEEYGRS